MSLRFFVEVSLADNVIFTVERIYPGGGRRFSCDLLEFKSYMEFRLAKQLLTAIKTIKYTDGVG